MTTPVHEPTPEFTRFLEWQLTTAVRRQTRFAEPPRPGYVKHLGIAALVVVSILVGAGGVTAASRIQANEQTRALLAQQAAEVLVAETQVTLAKEALALARRQKEVGTSTADDVAEAERALQRATAELKRASLNSEEVAASGKPVQDDLTAPLVKGRDFVSERLDLDQQTAATAVAAATAKLKATKTRYEVGLLGEVELGDAQAMMTRAAVEARESQAQMDLRKQFLAGKVKAADIARLRLINATTAQLAIAEGDLAAARQRFALAEKRMQVGTTGEVDLLKAKVQMLTLEQDVARLKARIRQLEQAK